LLHNLREASRYEKEQNRFKGAQVIIISLVTILIRVALAQVTLCQTGTPVPHGLAKFWGRNLGQNSCCILPPALTLAGVYEKHLSILFDVIMKSVLIANNEND